MRITLCTLFPEWFTSPLSTALIGRAVEKGLLEFRFLNPRDWTEDRHHTVDDRPYGGGPGMVMMPEPLVRALQSAHAETPEGTGPERVILLSARGRPFTQEMARELAGEKALTLICGRYEGIDARLGHLVPLEEVCTGDAVLNGGEAAAMLLIEAAVRLLPGFMGKEASGTEESFSAGLLEYPQYTRPEHFQGESVPEILLSGDHGRIARWRREQSLLATLRVRPDLLAEAPLSDADLACLREHFTRTGRNRPGRNLSCALVHHPVWLGDGKCGTTSLTNLDIHDIARCSRTYGLHGFTVVTPIEDQQRLLETLLVHWTQGAGSLSNPDRARALELVDMAPTVQEALDRLERHFGQRPVLVGTSAREAGKAPRMTPGQIRALLYERPVLLLFGTGHGMAPEILETCDGILRPLRWMDAYNHLPVRGAVAITLDRVLGDVY